MRTAVPTIFLAALTALVALTGPAGAQPFARKPVAYRPRAPWKAAPHKESRPTPHVDRTFSMVNRGGLLGKVARAFRRLRHKPLTVQVRVQSAGGLQPPEQTLQTLAVAAGRMHERRHYPISNLCRRVSVDLGDQIERAGAADATLLYNGNLSKVSRALMPKGWKKPIGWGNHWVTYCTIGGLHYAVDGTAQDYLNRQGAPGQRGGQGRLDAEIFVAGSSSELQTMLAKYYGGKPEAWVRQRDVNLHRLEHRGSRRGRWKRLPKAFYQQAFEAIPFPD